MLKEFQTFIEKGNVIDLAVGVIVGGAFGKITASLVDDILMPIIGLFLPGGVHGAITLKSAKLDAAGATVEEAIILNYGNFLNTVINFLIIAWVVFLIVKVINKLREKFD
ncbi:MAG: large conductance mechanosensitive channel protein MscL [Spirosomataceae bacterium]